MISDFSKWTEVTRGIYRYVIAAKVCYEIHMLCWHEDVDIKTAKASLFIAREWRTENGIVFERKCLLEKQPLFECLSAAERDNKENNS